MKTLVFVLILTSLSSSINAQMSDFSLIEKTVSYYMEGGTNNDFETLEKAFHKDATMLFISNDGYRQVNALAFFKNAIKPGPKQNRKTSIESINVMGTAASTKLKIEYETFIFIDYMNLLKIDGEWKVVNKVFHRYNIN